MRFRLFILVSALSAAALAWPVASVAAEGPALEPLVKALAVGGFGDKEKAIEALAATGDPKAVPVLEAMLAGDLVRLKADKTIAVAEREGRVYKLRDALTGAARGEAPSRAFDKVRVNNRLRRALRAALGELTLLSPDPDTRREAAEAVFKAQDPDAIPALDKAIARETDTGIKARMQAARAAAVLKSDRPEEEKVAAVALVGARGDREALDALKALQLSSEGAVKAAAAAAIERIEQELALWGALQNVWYGLSLGSVLLLAAIGLAITFGVMGVINMAHGEMVMLGAYTAFVVQGFVQAAAPGLIDWSLLIAVPLAFLVAGGVGVGIERGVIRFLYGRPLETLLATWGISLILQQAVRTLFGPTNQPVVAPSYMSGSFQLGQLAITYNRLVIILFALFVLVALAVLMRRTPFGLQMRAVKQNRAMAGAMGIRTPRIDALTFGLGSGIAGMAGVALSQIDNVSPNLGQGYIIDSFMVVVFGGVGNLWGTLVGAMTLGVVNKFLEPYAGAVLGKILVLVFIILFIQKRPRGLFALKGRAVEA